MTKNKLTSPKNRVFLSLVGPSERGKSQLIYKWLTNGAFQPKLDTIYFFLHHSHPLNDVMHKKKDWKPWVCSRCKLWIYRFVKKNGTKYFLFFDDSCQQICNWKVLVDIATARGHPGSNTIYINHNLLHQSTFAPDLELQNTHSVLFKRSRDVMQSVHLLHNWETDHS